MTLRTFSDCARCPFLAICDAHVTKGTHKHREGPDPCERIADDEQYYTFR